MFTKRNLITYLVALLFILTLNFFLPRMMPGDPIMAIYGDEARRSVSPWINPLVNSLFPIGRRSFGVTWDIPIPIMLPLPR